MLLSQLEFFEGAKCGLQIDIPKLVEIVRHANEEVLAVYMEAEENWELRFKEDNSPITIADKRAHEMIIKGLNSLETKQVIGIISEEDSQHVPYEIRRTWNWVWLVDPLDGTKEFIKRNGEFTVNIGLAHNGECVGGIVSIPVSGKCYLGFRGMGAWVFNLNEADGADIYLTPIQTKKFDWTSKDLILIGSRSHQSSLETHLLSTIDPSFTRHSCGSSLKMLAVAEGAAHIYPRFVPCSEWDTCAAHAILKEAGGNIYDVSGDDLSLGKELKYNKEDILNPYFVCVGSIDLDRIPKRFNSSHPSSSASLANKIPAEACQQ